MTKLKKHLRRITQFSALTVGASLLLAGCAMGSQEQSNNGDGQSQTDNELTVAITAFPSSWDQDFVAFDMVALMFHKNLYPYMVDYGVTEVDGGQILDTENIIPTWAESFETEDGQNWTLNIREDAVFPSGNPVTAEDVKWSKDRAFAAQANVAGIYGMIGLTDPSQVVVVDEHTVRFEQSTPSALAPQIQAISLFTYDSQLLQEHATDDDPWAQEWVAQNPADGGYFVVSDFTPGQEIVLTKNPDYPAENEAQIETIRFTVVSDTAAAAVLLRQGDVDMALGLTNQEIEDLANADNLEILSAPNNDLVHVSLNSESDELSDPKVRQALAYAMPYDQIINGVYGGEARRAKSLVPLDMPGYDDSTFPYEQDFDKASALLEEAGVDALDIELVYAAENVEHQQIAVQIQSALANIDVTITPTPLDPATLGERRAARDIAMQINAGQIWVNDVEYLVNIQYSSEAFSNYANYSNPIVDENVVKARTITDPAERNALWAEIQAEFNKDLPAIPLAQPNFRLPVATGVDGFVQPVDGLLRFNTFTKE